MESQLLNSSEIAEGPKKSGIAIDYKRILFRAVRYWYIIAFSVTAGIIIAYLTNRYTTRIYPVTASIIIREYAENADAKFLYNNPLVNSYRNYFNEPYIIRSYPLITSVVEDLNFHVSIVKPGDIKESEKYNSLPFSIRLLSKKRSAVLQLEYLGNDRFRCSRDGGEGGTDFSISDTLECQGVKFLIEKKDDLLELKGAKFLVKFLDPVQIAGAYISKLRVSWALPGSSVVNLDVNGPIAQKEIDFLNGLISAYQRYDLEKKNQAAIRSLSFIDDQLAKTGDSLKLFENALEEFKKQNFVTDLSSEAKKLYDQLKLLGEQRAMTIFAENYYKYLEEYLKHGRAYEQVILPSSIGVSDAVLNGLVSQLITLQTEYNALAAMSKNNPMVTDKGAVLTSGINESKKQLIEAITNLRATDKIKISGIDRQISLLEVELKGLPGAERRLVHIQRNYTLNENLFVFLQQKRAEAGISKASTTTDVMVVNPPRVSGGAITPKVTQNYGVYGGLGLILPFLVFVLIEVFNTRIQSREDIENITSIPFLGGIGHKETESNLVVFDRPKSAMAESFRALRSNLNYFTSGQDRKVFMVTSSISGEGKTFTTINLASVFALSGKRTLIIGADLRKPKIFQDFKLGNDRGLSTYLSSLHSLDEVIQPTGLDCLDLISGGPVPPNPSELILNPRMDEMMKVLGERYEFILLDTPPLALITDGLVLAKYAHHTLYLVRQNYTPKSLLNLVDELYRTDKLQNISLVMNDVYRTGPGYGYGYAYGYGYGYGYGYYGGRKKKNGSDYYTE